MKQIKKRMSQVILFPVERRGDCGTGASFADRLVGEHPHAVRLKPLEASKEADQARVKGEVEVGEMSTMEQGSRIRAKAALKKFCRRMKNWWSLSRCVCDRRFFWRRGMPT